MRDGWAAITFGDAVELQRRRIDPRLLPPEQVLTHYSIPILDESGLPGREAAGSIQSHKFRVEADSVLVSLLNPRIPRSWTAAGGADTVCSTEFAVVRPAGNSILLPFLGVYCSAAPFWRSLQSLVSGTTGSRQRVKPEQLLSLTMLCPPLDDQRRIADLAETIDGGIRAAGTCAEAHAVLETRVVTDWVRTWNGPTATVGDLGPWV